MNPPSYLSSTLLLAALLSGCEQSAAPAQAVAPAPPAPTRPFVVGQPGAKLLRIDPGRALRPVDDPRDIPSRWQGAVIIDFEDHRSGSGFYLADLFDAEPGHKAQARHVSARWLRRLGQDLVAASELAEQLSFDSAQLVDAVIAQRPMPAAPPRKRARGERVASPAAPGLVIESVGGRLATTSAPSASSAPRSAQAAGVGKRPADHGALVTGATNATNTARGRTQDCGLHGAKPPAGPLARDSALERAAQDYAELMARHDHFGHTGPDGSTPQSRASAAGYKGPAGENLAMGPRTGQAAIDGLLESDGHCKNMMSSDYQAIGIGVAEDGRGKRYWVQMFGVTR